MLWVRDRPEVSEMEGVGVELTPVTVNTGRLPCETGVKHRSPANFVREPGQGENTSILLTPGLCHFPRGPVPRVPSGSSGYSGRDTGVVTGVRWIVRNRVDWGMGTEGRGEDKDGEEGDEEHPTRVGGRTPIRHWPLLLVDPVLRMAQGSVKPTSTLDVLKLFGESCPRNGSVGAVVRSSPGRRRTSRTPTWSMFWGSEGVEA